MAVSEWGGEDSDGGLVALLSFRETAGSSFNRNHEESEESESKHHKRREGASESSKKPLNPSYCVPGSEQLKMLEGHVSQAHTQGLHKQRMKKR